jgi:hypothetical protein
MAIKHKLNEWSKRYVPAEIAAITGTLVCGVITQNLFSNLVLTALSATWGENLGFYSWMLYTELKFHTKNFKKISAQSLIKTIRNIIVEFGPGEALDSFVIRPISMYTLPLLVNNLALGLFLGKLCADTVFYILTIGFLELRKKYLIN